MKISQKMKSPAGNQRTLFSGENGVMQPKRDITIPRGFFFKEVEFHSKRELRASSF